MGWPIHDPSNCSVMKVGAGILNQTLSSINVHRVDS